VEDCENSDVNPISYLIYMRRNSRNFFSLLAEIFIINESGLSVVESNQPKVFAQIGAFSSVGRG
jgi:hypothetical protein